MIASVWAQVGEHVISFAAGLLLGFVATSRYRLVKRENGNG